MSNIFIIEEEITTVYIKKIEHEIRTFAEWSKKTYQDLFQSHFLLQQ